VTSQSNLRYQPALGRLLYVLALLLIVQPLSQWMLIVWPIHADVGQWRFGAIQLLEERLTLPVVGLFTAIAAASLLEHRAIQGILSGLSLLAAAVLAGLAATIALDGLQLRHAVRVEMVRGFDRSLARMVLVLLYGAVVAAVLGWAALKARGKKEESRSEPTPLVRADHAPPSSGT
jgi:hypothetical protein